MDSSSNGRYSPLKEDEEADDEDATLHASHPPESSISARKNIDLQIEDTMNEDDQELGHAEDRRSLSAIITRVWRSIFQENWIFLALVGLIAGCVTLCIDLSIFGLYLAQNALMEWIPSTAGQWLTWIVWSCVFTTLSILVVEFISPHAAGSGIPEMKCILSGIEIDRFLNFRTLVAKISGLIFAFAGGLSVGKEGPFVHISAILCSLLSKLRAFSHLRKHQTVYFQLLAAACGTGTTVAFGTPVGGVLFSIEVTSSFYFVDSLWRTFFVATCAQFVFTISHRLTSLELFEADWTVGSWDLRELVAFVAIGIFGGLFGGLFVKLLSYMFRLTRISPKLSTWWGHIVRACLIAALIGLIAYPLPLLRNDMKTALEYLAKADVVENIWMLLGVLVAKFVATLLSVAGTGTTAGIYSPVFLTGAVLGRISGELMNIWFPSLHVSPGAYAIVGAAAFASGVTRTMSTAVLAVELTRQIGLIFPVMVAVLVSIGVGRLITPSVYSVLIQQKDLPAMPRYKLYNSSRTLTKLAADIMTTDVPAVVAASRYADIAKIVARHSDPTFPLVDNNGMFLGVVKRRNLVRILSTHGIICKQDTAEFVGSGTTCIARIDLDSVQLDEALAIQQANPPASIAQSKRSRSSSIDALTAGIKHALAGSQVDVEGIAQHGPQIFERQVPFLFAGERGASDVAGVVDVDSSALQVSEQTSLSKVHFLFSMLGLSHLFVTSRGRLVGVIMRKTLIEAISTVENNRKPDV